MIAGSNGHAMSKPVQTTHPALQRWVEDAIALCTPDAVEWCDGSQAEWDRLTSLMVEKGTFTRLNPAKRPNSFLARSTPSDVARVEDRTYICSKRPDEAGPTNHWADPAEMRAKMKEKFAGSMKGRTLYVIPFCMGPLDSPLARVRGCRRANLRRGGSCPGKDWTRRRNGRTRAHAGGGTAGCSASRAPGKQSDGGEQQERA